MDLSTRLDLFYDPSLYASQKIIDDETLEQEEDGGL